MTFIKNEAKATWCIAGNSSQGLIVPAAGSVTTGGINPSGKVPYWSFVGTAGVCYYFSLCASANTEDVVLSVYNGTTPGGNLMAANDQGVCPNLSSLTFVCPANGTYYIAANLYPANTFATTALLKLTYYTCGAVTPVATPISDNWTGVTVTTACTSWMAQGAGGEGDWAINNVALGFAYGTNLACGSGNELILAGDQYNLYGIGVSKTPNIISYPINTNGTNSMVYSWKHTLQINGDVGITGSNTINIQLQSSNDLINWTTQWTGSYPVTAVATVPVNCFNQSVTIATNTNVTTWLRFYFSGVVGKIAYWAIDNGASGVIILPVELQGFAAKRFQEGIKLNWATASETNNNYFTIERSANGSDFTTIGALKGSGTSLKAIDYTFFDSQPLNGLNYYRLKQTDYNGKYTYSSITTANYAGKNKLLTNIYPNPTDNTASFDVYSPIAGNVHLELTDITGRIILDETRSVSEGTQNIEISLAPFDKGMYSLHVSVQEAGYSEITRILKN